jgi:hypothetical protein
MAKKSRRARRKRTPKRSARTTTTPSPAGTQDTDAEFTAAQRFAEEYAYVYSDLKRIAILAGSLLAALVALSFVIG